MKKIITVSIGILFLLSAAGHAAARQGKGPGTASRRQISPQTRNQVQKQIQENKNGAARQIKTQTRKRTDYIKQLTD